MPINSKGLIDTSVPPSLPFFALSIPLSLSLSFVIHRVRLSCTMIFVSRKRARDNDRCARRFALSCTNGVAPNDQIKENEKCLPDKTKLHGTKLQKKRVRGKEEDPGA
ncbi:hypothetical protein PUN28_013397 [Cardiocondyla obscurior]|uniref:Uncharacterized protein n=1 Tax=Cardiocondyla obscurior TaxID=286306 RepID=A0AAW2FD82_9HYME